MKKSKQEYTVTDLERKLLADLNKAVTVLHKIAAMSIDHNEKNPNAAVIQHIVKTALEELDHGV
jgi:hypothetical protein